MVNSVRSRPGLINRSSLEAGGGTPPSVPFSYDADTYWWDFSNSGRDVDTLGDDTVSYVPEKITNEKWFEQLVKDTQPLALASDGVTFNKDVNRQMVLNNVGTISNGKDGFYFAANVKFETVDGYLFGISRNTSSTVLSRGAVYVTGSRNFALRAVNNDGGTTAMVGSGPALTLNTWYTLEMRWKCNPNTLEIWHNGVLQTLASGPTGTFNAAFPSSNPNTISFGNSGSNGTDSFDGPVKEAIFHDGVPNDTIRSSISAYLNSVRPV